MELLNIIRDNWVLISGALTAAGVGVFATNKLKAWAGVQSNFLKWVLGVTTTIGTVLLPSVIQVVQNNAVNLNRVGISVGVATSVMQGLYLISKSAHVFLDDVAVARDARIATANALKLAGGQVEIQAEKTLAAITPVSPADFDA